MKKAYLTKQNKIAVKFFCKDKAEFFDLLEKIKGFQGRVYDSALKVWNLPYNKNNIEKLSKLDFAFDNNIINKLKANTKKEKIKFTKKQEKDFYKHQKEGIQQIDDFDGRVLLADEMGLGKTLQSLVWVSKKNELPALIVCPATMKIKWAREITKWTGESSIFIVSGKQEKTKLLFNTKYIIINYDILEQNYNWLKEMNFKTLIYDEAHYVKNDAKTTVKGKSVYKVLRTRYLKALAKNMKNIIAITGTPILSRPIEIFSSLNTLMPETFNSRWNFAKQFCDLKHNGFGYDYTGASNEEELNKLLLETVMIRRLKKDTLKDLPEKMPPDIIPLEIDNKKEYYEEEEELEKFLANPSDYEKGFQLTQGGLLKRMAAEGKLNSFIKWVEDFLESGEKLVIIAVHHKIIDKLCRHFGDIAVKLDGRDSQAQRNKSIDSFQNNKKIKLFIGNIKAAGIGVDLYAASNLAYVELGDTPGEHLQADDRIHRIGQKQICNYYYLVAVNTIEERIANMLDRKKKIFDKVVDGRETLNENLLSLVLAEMKNKKGV